MKKKSKKGRTKTGRRSDPKRRVSRPTLITGAFLVVGLIALFTLKTTGVLFSDGQTRLVRPPRRLLRQAASLAAANQFSRQIHLLRDFAAKHPNTILVNHALGAAYLHKGALDSAIIFLQKETGMNPGHADSYGLLGVAYERLGRIDAALASHQQEAKVAPYNWKPYYQMGVLYRRYLERLPEALAALTKAVELNPNATEPLVELGKVQAQLGKFDAARSAFRRALKLDPNAPEATYQLGQLLVRIGDDQGEEILERYERLAKERDLLEQLEKSGTAEHSFLAGEKYFQRKEPKKALAAFKKSLALDPRSWRALVGAGMAYMVSGRYVEALDAFTRAHTLAPREFDVNYRLALARAALKQKDGAIRALADAQAIRSLQPDEAKNAGFLFVQSGMVQEGIETIKRAFTGQTNDHKGLANLALLLHRLGKPDEAALYYQQACRIAPENIAYHLFWAGALLAQGKKTAAQKILRGLTSRQPAGEIWRAFRKLRKMPHAAELEEILGNMTTGGAPSQ